MKKQAVVHIGTHKTGSTSLQFIFRRNEELLSERGIYFPKSGRVNDRSVAVHNLAWGLLGHPMYTENNGNFDALKNELLDQDCPNNVLLTSEAFIINNTKQSTASFLQDFFSELGYELSIVVFIRPQYRFLDSSYSQIVKVGQTDKSFEEYVDSTMYHDRFNFNLLFKDWHTVFGGRLIVLPFEKSQFINSLEETFLSNLPFDVNVDCEKLIGVQQLNERENAKTVEVVRQLAKVAGVTGMSQSQKDEAIRLVKKFIKKTGDGSGKFSGLNNEIASKIFTHFKAVNEEFALNVLGRGDGRIFNEQEEDFAFEQNIYDLANASNEELMNISLLINEALSAVKTK